MVVAPSVNSLVLGYLKLNNFSRAAREFETECKVSRKHQLQDIWKNQEQLLPNLENIVREYCALKKAENNNLLNGQALAINTLWQQFDAVVTQLRYLTTGKNLLSSRAVRKGNQHSRYHVVTASIPQNGLQQVHAVDPTSQNKQTTVNDYAYGDEAVSKLPPEIQNGTATAAGKSLAERTTADEVANGNDGLFKSPKRKRIRPKRKNIQETVEKISPVNIADDKLATSQSISDEINQIFDTLLNSKDLQEKIADNINKCVTSSGLISPNTVKVPDNDFINSHSTINIDEILNMTRTDPSFESLFNLLDDKEISPSKIETPLRPMQQQQAEAIGTSSGVNENSQGIQFNPIQDGGIVSDHKTVFATEASSLPDNQFRIPDLSGFQRFQSNPACNIYIKKTKPRKRSTSNKAGNSLPTCVVLSGSGSLSNLKNLKDKNSVVASECFPDASLRNLKFSSTCDCPDRKELDASRIRGKAVDSRRDGKEANKRCWKQCKPEPTQMIDKANVKLSESLTQLGLSDEGGIDFDPGDLVDTSSCFGDGVACEGVVEAKESKDVGSTYPGGESCAAVVEGGGKDESSLRKNKGEECSDDCNVSKPNLKTCQTGLTGKSEKTDDDNVRDKQVMQANNPSQEKGCISQEKENNIDEKCSTHNEKKVEVLKSCNKNKINDSKSSDCRSTKDVNSFRENSNIFDRFKSKRFSNHRRERLDTEEESVNSRRTCNGTTEETGKSVVADDVIKRTPIREENVTELQNGPTEKENCCDGKKEGEFDIDAAVESSLDEKGTRPNINEARKPNVSDSCVENNAIDCDWSAHVDTKNEMNGHENNSETQGNKNNACTIVACTNKSEVCRYSVKSPKKFERPTNSDFPEYEDVVSPRDNRKEITVEDIRNDLREKKKKLRQEVDPSPSLSKDKVLRTPEKSKSPRRGSRTSPRSRDSSPRCKTEITSSVNDSNASSPVSTRKAESPSPRNLKASSPRIKKSSSPRKAKYSSPSRTKICSSNASGSLRLSESSSLIKTECSSPRKAIRSSPRKIDSISSKISDSNSPKKFVRSSSREKDNPSPRKAVILSPREAENPTATKAESRSRRKSGRSLSKKAEGLSSKKSSPRKSKSSSPKKSLSKRAATFRKNISKLLGENKESGETSDNDSCMSENIGETNRNDFCKFQPLTDSTDAEIETSTDVLKSRDIPVSQSAESDLATPSRDSGNHVGFSIISSETVTHNSSNSDFDIREKLGLKPENFVIYLSDDSNESEKRLNSNPDNTEGFDKKQNNFLTKIRTKHENGPNVDELYPNVSPENDLESGKIESRYSEGLAKHKNDLLTKIRTQQENGPSPDKLSTKAAEKDFLEPNTRRSLHNEGLTKCKNNFLNDIQIKQENNNDELCTKVTPAVVSESATTSLSPSSQNSRNVTLQPTPEESSNKSSGETKRRKGKKRLKNRTENTDGKSISKAKRRKTVEPEVAFDLPKNLDIDQFLSKLQYSVPEPSE